MKIDEHGHGELDKYEQQVRVEFISMLRQLADWYEARPNMMAPCVDTFRLYSCTKPEFLALRREAGLSVKDMDGDYVKFTMPLPGDWKFQLYTNKKHTCQRVKVGTQIIKAKPEVLLPAEPEKVIDVYEWQCDEPLLAESNGQPQPA